MKLPLTILAALTLLASPAMAHTRHHHHHYRHAHAWHHREARPWGFADVGYPSTPEAGSALRRRRYASGGTILPHPGGCPRIAFCGCGAAIEVFGRPVRELWLAANWFRFPPASPAAGMVAVRRHHVMVIREYRGDGMALVYDANSGGHLTRLHVVSLRGYSIRNPHGARVAGI